MATNEFNESARFQVFVSSTYLDLKDERKEVMDTLLTLDAFPAGMELFPATDGDAWELIEKVIAESDYYLLVIGGKYGSLDTNTNLSFTEKEYNYAQSLKIPVMAFIHGAPGRLPSERTEQTEEKQRSLLEFITKVKEEHLINAWTSSEQLGGKIAKSWNKFLRQNPATGWVRADRAASSATIEELGNAKIKIADLEAKVNEFDNNRGVVIKWPPKSESALQFDLWGRGVVVLEDKSLSSVVGAWIEIDTTLKEVFLAFGPELIEERTQFQIEQSLKVWFEWEFKDRILEIFHDAVETGGLKPEKGTHPQNITLDISINQRGINQVSRLLLQYKVLGLIERQEALGPDRPSPVWMLTPSGERNSVRVTGE